MPPDPVAVGDFSAEQVGEATETAKRILVASRLDPGMLTDGDIDAFVSLYAPNEREWVREQFSTPEWPAVLATRIAPGFRLLPAGPKVRGFMRVEAGERKGELRVRTSYAFAYAFHTDDPSAVRAPLDIVALYRAKLSFVWRDGDLWRRGDRGFAFDGGQGFSYSMACEQAKRGLLAPAYSGRLGLPAGRRPPEYFDPANPIPDDESC